MFASFLNLLLAILIFLSHFDFLHGFQNIRYVHIESLNPVLLSKSRPLSTVSTKDVLGYIPRLEIGLRFFKTHLSSPLTYSESIKFINPLEWIPYARPTLEINGNNIGKLFKDVSGKIGRFTSTIVKYLKKVAATSLIIASSLTLPGIKKISTITGSAVALASALPLVARAGVQKYSNLSPTQKLATTPLFFVCNSGGNAYLQEDIQAGNPDQRIITYFMSSEDANDYLNELAQGSPSNVNEFRVMTTSMEKIVGKIQARKQSRKLGRYPMSLVFRIQPSSRQCENAELVAGKGDARKGVAALKGVSIPMFAAKGMGLQRSNGEVSLCHSSWVIDNFIVVNHAFLLRI